MTQSKWQMGSRDSVCLVVHVLSFILPQLFIPQILWGKRAGIKQDIKIFVIFQQDRAF